MIYRTKWEYKIVETQLITEQQLNDLGAVGWEFISNIKTVQQRHHDAIGGRDVYVDRLVFKRDSKFSWKTEIPNNSTPHA
jgi:hypothetical protein